MFIWFGIMRYNVVDDNLAIRWVGIYPHRKAVSVPQIKPSELLLCLVILILYLCEPSESALIWEILCQCLVHIHVRTHAHTHIWSERMRTVSGHACLPTFINGSFRSVTSTFTLWTWFWIVLEISCETLANLSADLCFVCFLRGIPVSLPKGGPSTPSVLQRSNH